MKWWRSGLTGAFRGSVSGACPIIVFYCDHAARRSRISQLCDNVVEWFKKEGADAWYQHTPEELLPAGTKCPCGSTKWRKENDILDVWFDSGFQPGGIAWSGVACGHLSGRAAINIEDGFRVRCWWRRVFESGAPFAGW